MQILDNLIILLLLVLSFIAGKKISDKYNATVINELKYQIKLNAAQHGVGYVAQPAPKKVVPIGQPFMDKLAENGRAVQKINNK